jgi:hypothetical protein
MWRNYLVAFLSATTRLSLIIPDVLGVVLEGAISDKSPASDVPPAPLGRNEPRINVSNRGAGYTASPGTGDESVGERQLLELLDKLKSWNAYMKEHLVSLEEKHVRVLDPLADVENIIALSEWIRKKDHGKSYREIVEPCIQEWIMLVGGSGMVEKFNEVDLPRVMISLSRFLGCNRCRIEEGPIRDFLSMWVKAAGTKIGDFNAEGLSSSIFGLSEITRKYNVGLEGEFIRIWIEPAVRKLGDFNEQELYNSMSALARMRASGEEIRKIIEKEAEEFVSGWIGCALEKLQGLSGHELSSFISVLVSMGISRKETGFVSKWIKCALEKLEEFSGHDLSTSIEALSRAMWEVSRKETGFVSKWIRCALEKLEEFSGYDLSASIRVLSEMEVGEEEMEKFVSRWMECALGKLEEFDGVEFFRSTPALLRIKVVRREEFVSRWIGRGLEKLEEFDTGDLYQLIQALTKVSEGERRKLVSRWMEYALGRLPRLNSQGLFNSIWVLARIGVSREVAREFVSRWMECALGKLEGFSEGELSALILALARLGASGGKVGVLVTKWADCALGKREESYGYELYSGLPDLLWALIETKVAREEAKELARMYIGRVLKLDYFTFNKRNILELTLALERIGVVGEEMEEFIIRLVDCVVREREEFDGYELSDLILALPEMGFGKKLVFRTGEMDLGSMDIASKMLKKMRETYRGEKRLGSEEDRNKDKRLRDVIEMFPNYILEDCFRRKQKIMEDLERMEISKEELREIHDRHEEEYKLLKRRLEEPW